MGSSGICDRLKSMSLFFRKNHRLQSICGSSRFSVFSEDLFFGGVLF